MQTQCCLLEMAVENTRADQPKSTGKKKPMPCPIMASILYFNRDLTVHTAAVVQKRSHLSTNGRTAGDTTNGRTDMVDKPYQKTKK